VDGAGTVTGSSNSAAAPSGPTTEETSMLNFLGTIVFVTIITIGSLDIRSGLSLFGRYVPPPGDDSRTRPSTSKRRGGGDQPTPSAP
jgi:hypothetical protein